MMLKQAAELTKLSVTTIRRLCKEGKIAAEKVPDPQSVSGFFWRITTRPDDVLSATEHVRTRGGRRTRTSAVDKTNGHDRLWTVREIHHAVGGDALMTEQAIYSYIRANRIDTLKAGKSVFLRDTVARDIIKHYALRGKTPARSPRSLDTPAAAGILDRLGRIEVASARIEELLGRLVQAWS